VETQPHSMARQGAVRLLVGCVSAFALTCVVVSAGGLWETVSTGFAACAGFVGITVLLQLMAVRTRSRYAVSGSGIALLAAGFTLGTGAAILAALTLACVHSLRSRPPLHRALFNASVFVLAAAAAASLYHLLETGSGSAGARLAWALAAASAYWAINNGLLALAMGLAEGRSPIALWRERLSWITPHYFVAAIVAVAATAAYADFGLFALLVLGLPPALVLLRSARPRRAATA
jgi:hypothetical protein